ncbi:MAG: Asp/Glu racemase [Actinomycetota bacterium]|nr:Asp/Glu racemase [Actinomycetota bacterium]
MSTGIGVVVPHDMALDRELWRWVPDDVSLHLTRTPHSLLEVTVEMVTLISDYNDLAQGVKNLVATESKVYAYACTSGSFVRGRAGESELVQAMIAAGAPAAVTTTGALSQAVSRLGASRVSVATPYEKELTVRLGDFLVESGVQMVASAHLGLARDIAKVPYETTAALVREADHPDADAIVVSCTNLATYDLIAPLEAELGKPVVTANQATIWAALGAMGRRGVGPGQRLLQV